MPAPLTNQLCYTLYATSIAINRIYKPMLDLMGITYPQYLILNVLDGVPDGQDGITIGAIASRLALESSTVTPPVKRLEQAGLVTRQRSRIDERLVQVQLTKAGRAVLLESRCLGETLVERSGMTRTQLDALNRRVLALRDALNNDHP